MRETLRLAGQLLAVGFEGQAASPDVKHLIRHYGVGGVVLFARNVDAPEQVAELVRELQECARDAGHVRPLLVAVDQEGGRVARLRAPWTLWPPARALGRVGSEELAREQGELLAAELRACGITLDFAPVVDVDTNPKNPVIGDRSYGDDPDLVARLGAAFITGLQAGRVAACAKHFPGHGDTALDSHHDLPLLDHSRARLDDVELRPFRRAIAAGVATVMVGHLLVREWDDVWPATLSSVLVEGLLRRDLGFSGVIVADDFEMKAVATRWRPEQLGARALEAGCDLLLGCRDHDVQVGLLEGLVRAVEGERIPWQRLEDAEQRVRALKQQYCLPYADPNPRAARLAAGGARAHDLAQRLTLDSGLVA
jgi:beta-N-acetylhexosaminidase